VWVATKTNRIDDIAPLPTLGETRYVVDHLEIGTVKAQDVEVRFPVGCHVMDLVQKVAYTILPGGRYELTRFANSESHKIFNPPANNIVGNVAGAARLYTSEPLELASNAMPLGISTSWRRPLSFAAAAIMLAAIGGLLVWRRRFKRA
jgi:hypothetical protein